jgi:hypothetical protein
MSSDCTERHPLLVILSTIWARMQVPGQGHEGTKRILIKCGSAMSSVPDPKTNAVRRRRRRGKESGWKNIPSAAKILIGLCLLVLIFFPVAQDNGWFKRRIKEAPVAEVHSSELVLDEVQLQKATRTLKGFVVNRSGKAYKDVVVSYSMSDVNGGDLGVIMATISTVAPHQRAAFETDPMPEKAMTYGLREIVGTPR